MAAVSIILRATLAAFEAEPKFIVQVATAYKVTTTAAAWIRVAVVHATE